MSHARGVRDHQKRGSEKGTQEKDAHMRAGRWALGQAEMVLLGTPCDRVFWTGPGRNKSCGASGSRRRAATETTSSRAAYAPQYGEQRGF
jgi:hypothetical protein